MTYFFTRDAEEQLESINYYIAQNNPEAAQRVYDHVIASCEMITAMPTVGRHPHYITNPNILCVNVKKYHSYPPSRISC